MCARVCVRACVCCTYSRTLQWDVCIMVCILVPFSLTVLAFSLAGIVFGHPAFDMIKKKKKSICVFVDWTCKRSLVVWNQSMVGEVFPAAMNQHLKGALIRCCTCIWLPWQYLNICIPHYMAVLEALSGHGKSSDILYTAGCNGTENVVCAAVSLHLYIQSYRQVQCYLLISLTRDNTMAVMRSISVLALNYAGRWWWGCGASCPQMSSWHISDPST